MGSEAVRAVRTALQLPWKAGGGRGGGGEAYGGEGGEGGGRGEVGEEEGGGGLDQAGGNRVWGQLHHHRCENVRGGRSSKQTSCLRAASGEAGRGGQVPRGT